MIDKLFVRPNTTALLLMDFQRMVVDSYAVDKEALLDRVKRLALAVRNSGAMMIHVVVSFQLGYPEVSGQNSVFSNLKAAGLLALGDPAVEIYPELTPQPGDDMDYRAVVVADGCSDKDPEVQRVLMEKIFPFQARVATVEEVIGALP